MRNFQLIFIIMLSVSIHMRAQDTAQVRKILDTLSSESMWGRGYTKDGMQLAANYIADFFKAQGIQLINGTYLQTYQHPVNTFPSSMKLEVNGKRLEPGKDFIISPESKGLKGKSISMEQMDTSIFVNRNHRLIVEIKDKLVWTPAGSEADHTYIILKKDAVTLPVRQVSISIDQLFIPAFEANNVIGMVPGTERPDSFVVITAHYDHLGGMGDKVYFPGANDNASGTAMMLDMAAHYAAHPPKYSIVFIAFGSEEIGLLGSQHFVNNPWIDLARIKFLINIDLMGNGDEGITVVNATEHPAAFNKMKAINEQYALFKTINERGKAANSDHHFFVEKGVPAFFIYTLGGNGAYHDIYDIAAGTPMHYYPQLFQLLTEFITQLR